MAELSSQESPYAVYAVFLACVGLVAQPTVASALLRGPDLLAQLLFTPLLAGWSIWIGIAISARASDLRVAQQLGIFASLPTAVVAALVAFNVIHATLGLALGCSATDSAGGSCQRPSTANDSPPAPGDEVRATGARRIDLTEVRTAVAIGVLCDPLLVCTVFVPAALLILRHEDRSSTWPSAVLSAGPLVRLSGLGMCRAARAFYDAGQWDGGRDLERAG